MDNQKDSKSKVSSKRRYFSVILAFIIGLVFVLIACRAMYQFERTKFVNSFRLTAINYSHTIQEHIDINLGFLQSIESFFNSSRSVARDEFKTFVAPTLKRQDAVQTFVWVPYVGRTNRIKYTNEMQKEVPGFQIARINSKGDMIKAANKKEYLPVGYIEPQQQNKAILGFDLASSPMYLTALNEARDTGQMITTGYMSLNRAKQKQFKFAVFAPIYKKNVALITVKDRQKNILGFVGGTYNIDKIIMNAIYKHTPQKFELRVFDLSSKKILKEPYSQLIYGENKTAADKVYAYKYNHEIKVANRHWLLEFVPIVNVHHTFWLPWIIFGGGLIITLLICAYIWSILKHAEDLTSFARKYNRMAHHDVLTTLPNRLSFEKTLRASIAYARRHKSSLALLFLDFDGFKNVNDKFGHRVGDLLLEEAAKRMKLSLREYDFVARIGGDEFAIIIPGVNESEDVGIIADKLLKELKEIYSLDENEIHITASIGIAVYPGDGEDVETLVKNADIAAYSVKQTGRNNYKYFSGSLDKKHRQKMELSNELCYALERQEIYLVYQPIFELNPTRLISMEVLSRWKHPKFGLVSPNVFIPIAERSGLIYSIDEWVLRTACKQFLAWGLDKAKDITLSVNLSSRELLRKNLPNYITDVLSELKMPPEKLGLEVTGTTIMMNLEVAQEILKQLCDAKIYISIDDFGTGYSSLERLKSLPISILKIDQSFVQDIGVDANDEIIIKSIIKLGRDLKLKIIAEGVETEEQLQFLINNNCDRVQGFYLSKPLTVEKFTEFLKK